MGAPISSRNVVSGGDEESALGSVEAVVAVRAVAVR
jgi:hypothetical protein